MSFSSGQAQLLSAAESFALLPGAVAALQFTVQPDRVVSINDALTFRVLRERRAGGVGLANVEVL